MTGVIATRLDLALKAVGIPIVGVSVDSPTDRTKWRIDYTAAATAQHRTDGEALKATFDPTAQAVIDSENAALAKVSSASKDRLADIALLIRFKDIPAWNALTLAQKKAAVQAQQAVWESMRDFIEKNL